MEHLTEKLGNIVLLSIPDNSWEQYSVTHFTSIRLFCHLLSTIFLITILIILSTIKYY